MLSMHLPMAEQANRQKSVPSTKLMIPQNQIQFEITHRLAQLRTDGVAMAFFCLSVIVFIYVGFGSCASYVQAWLGEAPLHYTGLAAKFRFAMRAHRPCSSGSCRADSNWLMQVSSP